MKLQNLVELHKVIERKYGFVYRTEILGLYWFTANCPLPENFHSLPVSNRVSTILKYKISRHVDENDADLVEAVEIMNHPLINRIISKVNHNEIESQSNSAINSVQTHSIN